LIPSKGRKKEGGEEEKYEGKNKRKFKKKNCDAVPVSSTAHFAYFISSVSCCPPPPPPNKPGALLSCANLITYSETKQQPSLLYIQY
jgi:hypothetical protein